MPLQACNLNLVKERCSKAPPLQLPQQLAGKSGSSKDQQTKWTLKTHVHICLMHTHRALTKCITQIMKGQVGYYLPKAVELEPSHAVHIYD